MSHDNPHGHRPEAGSHAHSFGSRFGRFVRKRGRWVYMGGAFIVFATFVFKEGLAEHWKDEANTLDMIQYFVAIRHDTSVTAALLESGVQQRLLGLSGPEAPEDGRALQ